VDLPRSQGATTTHSGAYVEEEQRGERGKDQARSDAVQPVSAVGPGSRLARELARRTTESSLNCDSVLAQGGR